MSIVRPQHETPVIAQNINCRLDLKLAAIATIVSLMAQTPLPPLFGTNGGVPTTFAEALQERNSSSSLVFCYGQYTPTDAVKKGFLTDFRI